MTDATAYPTASPLPRLILTALVTSAILFGAFYLTISGQAVLGAILLAVAVAAAIIFGANRFYGARFIFPGIAAVLVFVAFPVAYTVYLGFTNYSSFNLLTQPRVAEILASRRSIDPTTETPFALAETEGGYTVWLPDLGLTAGPFALDETAETIAAAAGSEPTTLLSRRDALAFRSALGQIAITTPDGTELRNTGLRSFAQVTPEFAQTAPDTLTRTADGTVFTADPSTGFFTSAEGEQLTPGWRVNIGWANFERVFTSDGIRAPMITIFLWTFGFAALSVLTTFSVGLLLAVILQWEHLRFKAIYRILLILPYAVPAFISILVFRGLFNQNFGEINLILNALFGLNPAWFTDGTLARTMIVIVNTWLGYPYMMLLAMGFLQSVPQDHKKAAALEGASSLRVFFTITLPQIIPPFLPLLIASFAFNFNNLVLVLLLTRGLPDIPGTVIPAGETDILASFTYRLAFNDSAQQFGLAGAITLLIFLVVAVISYANFVAMRRAAAKRGGRT